VSNGGGLLYGLLFMVARSRGRRQARVPVAWVRYDDGSVQEFVLDRLRLEDFRDSAPWRQVRSRHGQTPSRRSSAPMGSLPRGRPKDHTMIIINASPLEGAIGQSFGGMAITTLPIF
jgi:hypothetical protein